MHCHLGLKLFLIGCHRPDGKNQPHRKIEIQRAAPFYQARSQKSKKQRIIKKKKLLLHPYGLLHALVLSSLSWCQIKHKRKPLSQ